METRGRRLSSMSEVATDSDKSPTSAESVENESNKTEGTKEEKKQRGRRGDGDSFQKEIEKWEEFYDDMKSYLTDGTLSPRSQANVLKQADSFLLNSDGALYYIKTLRDSTETLMLPVIQTYEERMQVCRSIHLSTGDNSIHNRRDTMLDLLGQQYYWKGQRRDVCQCIASCEICSIGLGGKRRAKPPGQRRDIRPPPKKHPRLALTPVIPVSEINTASYLPPPTCSPPSTTTSSTTSTTTSTTSSSSLTTTTTMVETGNNTSEKTTPIVTVPSSTATTEINTVSDSTETTTNTAPHIQQQQQQQQQTQEDAQSEPSGTIHVSNSSTPLKKPRPTNSFSRHNSAFTPVDPFANLYTIAEACLLNNSDSNGLPSAPQSSRANPELSIASEVTVSDNSGLQIFTTINEPYYDNHSGRNVPNGPSTKNSCQPVIQSDLCLDDSVVGATASGGDDEQYVVQGSSSCGPGDTALNSSSSAEPSIYQLLFQLPSVPSTTLCTAVIESMQMSLKNAADPAQLAKVAGQSLISVFNLSSSTLQAIVCPSRAAAYITSLAAAILTKQGQLTTTTPLSQQTSSTPSLILHDAICDAGSPKAFSSLLGACNWSLGTHTAPMTKEELCTAITSNRVTALLYRPFVYSKNTSFLHLDALSSICRSQTISLIVDCCGLIENSLFQLTSTMKEMLTTGADLIMLPTTEQFQGPPHTCILIGRIDLLNHYWQLLSHLQSDLPLPLFCSSYDIVGSVVAFKSLQVTSFKTEPMNFDY